MGRWLVLGVVAKLTASYLRYLTLVVGYEGDGDATSYDEFGRRFARAWMGEGTAPELQGLRKTNFLRWFTGVVYYLFGSNVVVGFFVFGLLALVGSYLWYRATVDAVPHVDKRIYLALVLFAPSIVFWPSSIGKEALMQLGIGVMALGTAFFLRQRLQTGLALGAAGGWLLWVVRPHLLALVTVAAGCAYLVGRVRTSGHGLGSLVARPVGLITVAVLVAFTVTQGVEFLGIEELSLSSIDEELDATTEQTAQGGIKVRQRWQLPEPAQPAPGCGHRAPPTVPVGDRHPVPAALVVGVGARRRADRRPAQVAADGAHPRPGHALPALLLGPDPPLRRHLLVVRQLRAARAAALLVLPALFVLLAVSPALERMHREGARSVEDARWDVHALG